ncbi:MAG: pantoate--beta-alanine ligase [Verrucomicrobiota bacterium]
MRVFQSKESLRAWRGQVSGPVVLVPTMGALHRGHQALLEAGRRLAGDGGHLVASIFVNPTQFGPGEDFESYPQSWAEDLAMCRAAGVEGVFAPSAGQLYAEDASLQVSETLLSETLCGASRPGHFAGVCLVVLKLFHLVQPQEAVFGKKDFQQFAILRRMVRDLDLPVTLHGLETVREADGLALSSRNRYLSPAERKEAVCLRRALGAAEERVARGESAADPILSAARAELARASLGRLDYLELVEAESLQPVRRLAGPSLLAVAMFFGEARLIDNVELFPPAG